MNDGESEIAAAARNGAEEELKLDTTKVPAKLPANPVAVADVLKIVPRNLDECWRLANGFAKAGMVSESLQVWRDSKGDLISASAAKKSAAAVADTEGTVARCALVIMKGMEVGLGPVTAMQTIMVINNKTAIYGDGAKALVHGSGVLEYEKNEITGTWEDKDYVVKVTLKRKDQTEAITREFGYKDAEKAGLLTKFGPWTQGYAKRQCYWRAWSWAARDTANDALCGLSIAEEVRDYETQQKRIKTATDTSALDDTPPTEEEYHGQITDNNT